MLPFLDKIKMLKKFFDILQQKLFVSIDLIVISNLFILLFISNFRLQKILMTRGYK